MNLFVLIRKFKKNDEFECNNLVKDFIMNCVQEAFLNCLFREITLQLIVLMSAIFFIFFGVPLIFCVISIPGVIIFMFLCVYISYFNKSMELTNEVYKDCWVAEVYEPLFLRCSKQDLDYCHLETEDTITFPEIQKMKKKIIGTMSIKKHRSLENSAWIFRTAINKDYNFTKIGELLLFEVLKYCRDSKFSNAEVLTTECDENVREMFLKMGFNIQQIYNKKIAGCLKILKSQLGINFFQDQDLSTNESSYITIT